MTRRITRRAFTCDLAALVGSLGLACLPVKADAQQPAAPRRIGVLLVAHSPEGEVAQKFRQGLRDAGYLEGRDVVIEWRSPNGDYARVPELIADLVQRKVEVIVVDGTVGTRAAKRATSTIPIVMVLVADPIGSGLVASLAHPVGKGDVGKGDATLCLNPPPDPGRQAIAARGSGIVGGESCTVIRSRGQRSCGSLICPALRV